MVVDWIRKPSVGKIWRKLREQGAKANIIVPIWTHLLGGIWLLPIPFAFLSLLWIGLGFPRTTLIFSSRGKTRAVALSRRRIGRQWPCGSTPLQTNQISCSQNAIVAFKKVVIDARATLWEGNCDFSPNFGWARKNINMNYPAEMKFVGRFIACKCQP